jgi:hypothetical protein
MVRLPQKLNVETYLEDLLMKMKKLVAASAVLSAFAGFVVPAAHAEVAASVSASNMYYWRGYDLGGGAALAADVNVSADGFIGGVWTSSGDGTLGTEWDLYGAYSGKAGDFTYGLGVTSYNYAAPKGYINQTVANPAGDRIEAFKVGDYVEVIPTIGYGPLKITYYDAVVADHAPLDNKDYSYATAELIFDSFSFKYGQHMNKSKVTSAHVDATYKYNDKLSFTAGSIVDDGGDSSIKKELNVVVTLTLPIL